MGDDRKLALLAHLIILWFGDHIGCSYGKKAPAEFCFDGNNEGFRLHVPVLKELQANSGPECVLHCLQYHCCRSVNYKKTCSTSERERNCELLHGVISEQSAQLKRDTNVDHLLLVQPNRPFNCSCLSCGTYQICVEANKNCSCRFGMNGNKCSKEKVRLHIHVKSSGDPTGRYANILVNGTDYAKNTRGLNFVVIDGETGNINKSISFDTYANKNEVTNMIEFLNAYSSQKNKIILAAIRDEASRQMTEEAYLAISKIAAENITSFDFRGCFALIGFTERKKPPFVKQIQNNGGEGPSIITETIEIPVIF